MKKTLLFLSLPLFLLLSACSVMTIKDYNPNYRTTRDLEAVKMNFSAVKVKSSNSSAENTLASSGLSCRGTTFEMPPGKKVKDFIEHAISSELDAAKKISATSKPMTIIVNSIDSDTSGFSTGTWTLDFNYDIDKKVISVKTVSEFGSAFLGQTACQNTAAAFEEAIRKNFSTFVSRLPAK